VHHQPACLDPSLDGFDLPANLPDMRQRAKTHRAIISGSASHLRAGCFHFFATPGIDRPLWMRLEQTLNYRRRQRVSTRLEGREQDDRSS
jgi:hypothetical protein